MANIECELYIGVDCPPHISQIVCGFISLYKKRFINLKIRYTEFKDQRQCANPNIAIAYINGKKVIYDTHDSGERYYKGIDKESWDYYFKRSYNKTNRRLKAESILPLGFNYYVTEGLAGIQSRAKNLVKQILYQDKSLFCIKDFESIPFVSAEPSICLLTRLWDPDGSEVEAESLKQERVEINQFRIQCLEECNKEFKGRFIGGLMPSDLAVQYHKDLIAPSRYTNKVNFLNIVKNTEICIATTGLHRSIGWRFGEYVAAARAIITEPLSYEVPGNFEQDKNYLVFSSSDELINRIYSLLEDQSKLWDMMQCNYQYYHLALRPDALIYNTIQIVLRS